jgi:DNA-binding protein H-NS
MQGSEFELEHWIKRKNSKRKKERIHCGGIWWKKAWNLWTGQGGMPEVLGKPGL